MSVCMKPHTGHMVTFFAYVCSIYVIICQAFFAVVAATVMFHKPKSSVTYRGLMCAFGKHQRVFQPWSLWMIWHSHARSCVWVCAVSKFLLTCIYTNPVLLRVGFCSQVVAYPVKSTLTWGLSERPNTYSNQSAEQMLQPSLAVCVCVLANGWQESIARGCKARLKAKASPCQKTKI